MIHRQGKKQREPGAPARRGRPAKAASERRTHRCQTTLTDAEAEHFDRCRGDYLPADYLRMLIVRSAPVPPLVPAVNLTEFARLYAALEDVHDWFAAARHFGIDPEIGAAILAAIADVRDQLVQLRRALIGTDD